MAEINNFSKPGQFSGENLPKIINLKQEFNKINNRLLNSPHPTKFELENLCVEYAALFEQFKLSEIQFFIKNDVENGKLIFEPIRNIDKLAIRGLLAMED